MIGSRWKAETRWTRFYISQSVLTSPKAIIKVPTKACVDSLSENDRKRPDLSTVCNNQDNDCDNKKLTILESFTVNRNRTIEIELSNKKSIDDELKKILFSDLIKC